MLNEQNLRAERLVRLNTVLQRTGLSRCTIYRKMSEGSFPRQLKLSRACVGWRESELDQWIAELSLAPVGRRNHDLRA